mmetsp:Transcript_12048/g.36292  ORF Transcript_12048/g.36292 Transcript_12048/m.36292 type:complete len:310 (+) Transcript_12048:878-1807(+)
MSCPGAPLVSFLLLLFLIHRCPVSSSFNVSSVGPLRARPFVRSQSVCRRDDVAPILYLSCTAPLGEERTNERTERTVLLLLVAGKEGRKGGSRRLEEVSLLLRRRCLHRRGGGGRSRSRRRRGKPPAEVLADFRFVLGVFDADEPGFVDGVPAAAEGLALVLLFVGALEVEAVPRRREDFLPERPVRRLRLLRRRDLHDVAGGRDSGCVVVERAFPADGRFAERFEQSVGFRVGLRPEEAPGRAPRRGVRRVEAEGRRRQRVLGLLAPRQDHDGVFPFGERAAGFGRDGFPSLPGVAQRLLSHREHRIQ